MTKRLGKVWWAIGALACTLLLASLALHWFFNKKHLNALAAERAQAMWSRELSIGDLSLHLLPYPALRAAKVSLSNPQWAHQRTLLEAERITAQLDLLPLLSGRIVFRSITADGLTLHLETSADGRKSWALEGMGGMGSTSAEQSSGTPVFDPKLLTSIELRNMRIHYQNGAAGIDTWVVEQLRAHARPGWRDVNLDARISHVNQTMRLTADLADLSALGIEGGVSEGKLEARWDRAHLTLSGRLPLTASLEQQLVTAELNAESLHAPLAFFGIKSETKAPLHAKARISSSPMQIQFSDLSFAFGNFKGKGEAALIFSSRKPAFNARLDTDRLDWAQFMHDLGRPPLQPKPAGELFRIDPLPWKMLSAMQGMEGQLDAKIGKLRLRTGTELQNARALMKFKDARLDMRKFSFNVFSGAASGNMQFDSRKKNIQLNLSATGISLGAWLSEKGKGDALIGGPMNISAQVSTFGNSMKELAASLTGRVTITMGKAKILSKKIQQAETVLVGLAPLFSEKSAEHVELACMSAQLPFLSGRAAAEPIAGARSSASQLLTSGFVDLREQTLDLRGRIRARAGISLGASAIAGNVRIAGKLLAPEIGLDPAGTPEAVARLGAAVLTGGVSLLATAIWDAAIPGTDACQAVWMAAESKQPNLPPSRQPAVKQPHLAQPSPKQSQSKSNTAKQRALP